MGTTDTLPPRAAAAPLALVALYVCAIAALPGAGASDIASIAGGHLVRNALLILTIGLVAVFIFCASAALRVERRAQLSAEITRFVQPEGKWVRLGRIAAPHLYLAVLLAAFSTYKQGVLPGAGFGFDSAFADLDRALFFGVDAWRVTHWILPGATATAIVDRLYMLWFLPMLLIVLLSGFLPAKLQVRYLLAFALVWIVAGTILASLLPAAGPCYVEAFHGDPRFAPLMERLAAQGQASIAAGGPGLHALTGQEMLLSVYGDPERVVFAGGISAMPSVHNGLAALFACAGFACHRVAGWLMTAFAALIWFGSIHLGWHYAIDGIVGAAIGLGMWKLAGLWVEQLWRAEQDIAAVQAVPA